MNKFAVFALFALAFQGILAKPADSTLDQLIADAKVKLEDVSAKLGLDDLPTGQEVVDKLKDNAQKFGTDIEDAVEKIKSNVDAQKPEVEAALKSIQEKLTQTAETLKQAGGESTKELKEKLDKGFQEAVEQVQQLQKTIEPEATEVKANLETAGKNLIDNINKYAEDLKTQLEKKN